MAAFEQFDKSMTNRALIISICSSMGFAACVTLTKCDLHLVSLLTKPLNKLGILLLPCCMLVTGVASLAIGSLAGLCAAIGPTLIALMPEQASDRRSPLLPLFPPHFRIIGLRGSTDNILVAQLAGIPVMEQINHISFNILILFGLCIVALTTICFIFGDYKKGGFQQSINEKGLIRPLPELPPASQPSQGFCSSPSGRAALSSRFGFPK